MPASFFLSSQNRMGVWRVGEQMTESREDKFIVWRLVDGKPGHENQSLGLCQALSNRLNIEQYDIPVVPRPVQLVQWLLGRFPSGETLPCPDMVLGAGHMTHFSLLAVKRRFGAKAVVIMNPSLPTSLFDLCIIPAHDQISGENVFVTQGVMNRVTASERQDISSVLILLGGPAAHTTWQENKVIDQVKAIVTAEPEVRFVLGDSRRTPPDCLEKVKALAFRNLELHAWQETGREWLGQQLNQSGRVWVTQDSVSMIYEAITSGAQVGLIELPQVASSRVAGGVRQLIEQGWVTPFKRWQARGELIAPPGKFNEAQRCADWMVDQWLISA